GRCRRNTGNSAIPAGSAPMSAARAPDGFDRGTTVPMFTLKLITDPRCVARVNDGLANLRALLIIQRHIRAATTTLLRRGGALHWRSGAALQTLQLLVTLRRAGATLGSVPLLVSKLSIPGLRCS